MVVRVSDESMNAAMMQAFAPRSVSAGSPPANAMMQAFAPRSVSVQLIARLTVCRTKFRTVQSRIT